MVRIHGFEKKLIINSRNIRKSGDKAWSTTERTIRVADRSPNSFRYVIGKDIGSDRNVTNGWTPAFERPYNDSIPAGGGAAIANLDNDPRPDLLLMGIEDLKEDNKFYYQIGFNMKRESEGTASSWTPITWGPSIGSWLTAGGGAAIADINRNGRRPMLITRIKAIKGTCRWRAFSLN